MRSKSQRVRVSWMARLGGWALLGLHLSTVGLFLLNYIYYSKATSSTRIKGALTPQTDTVEQLGAVSSLSKKCSNIGIDMLKRGGNAVDAAISTEYCLGVIGFELTGLGGGGFALVRTANGSNDFIDFREAAPTGASSEMFNESIDLSLYGGLASGVPGELRGLEYLHAAYGTLPWKDLVQPAVDIAREGFEIRSDTIDSIAGLESSDFLLDDPAWSIDLAPNGTLVGKGEIITRKRYADLLETVGQLGPNAFYTGSIAQATIRSVQNGKGIMTMDDLANYSVIRRPPIQILYRNYKLTSGGTPASGSVVLNIMKTVEGFEGFGSPGSTDLDTHRLDEVMKFGYGFRTKLGDPSFVPDMQSYEQGILQESKTAKVRSKISNKSTLPTDAYNPDNLEILDTPGTSHLTTIDANGLAVSLTSTINTHFGSRIIVPETGLILNNEMNDFSIPGQKNSFGYDPSPSNFVAPGKRPLSSIAPVIVEFANNNTLHIVTGAAGGSQIITSTVQILWNVLDRNFDAIQAVQEPRFHDQLSPNEVLYEYNFDNNTTNYMASLGHNSSWTAIVGNVQLIIRHPNGTFDAAAETRQKKSGGFVI